MRRVTSINFGWDFLPEYHNEIIQSDINLSNNYSWLKVNLPHTNKTLPYNYFNEQDFQFISMYKRVIDLTHCDKSKYQHLNFEGVMAYAQVYLNGHKIGEHKGGYTGFIIGLNNNPAGIKPRYDGTDEVLIVVDSTERPEIPPFGGQIDYLTYGGIYREVQLIETDNISIQHVFVKTPNCLGNTKNLAIDISIRNETLSNAACHGKIQLSRDGELIASKPLTISLSGNEIQEISVELKELEGIELWSISSPNLYQVAVFIDKDNIEINAGFREAYFSKDGFYLNGEKIKLVGLNRHQSFPYVGYAMPENVQKKDADILKYDLGLNVVRTSHYPQSRHFLDRCDEIGLLVFEEIPGWQHIGGEEWQNIAVNNVKEMIETDRNHPSIVLWGVRINESVDHHDLYIRTNECARQLDPTRQTGGVRNREGSELLEDVYTMNDFIQDANQNRFNSEIGYTHKAALRGQQDVTHLPYKVPYLVSEFNGHMYPTKKQDCEERVEEHTMRHLKILDAGYADQDISGVIGWCAFDYNTHKDFGSGDRICYHGIMDMYRTHKYASFAYQSQIPIEQRPILEAITNWSFGDRCEGMGKENFLVLTNCDRIDVIIGDSVKSYFPSRTYFKSLPNPPVVIPAVGKEWGLDWQGIELIGYHQGCEKIRRTYTEKPIFNQLKLTADTEQLHEKDTWDATRILVQAIDQAGNIIKYHPTIVNIHIDGPAQLIGPNQIMLHAGESAFWVRTNSLEGIATITAVTPEGKSDSVTLTIN